MNILFFSQIKLNTDMIKKYFLENSTIIEFVCGISQKFVEEKFGDDGYLDDEHGSSYTEEAQDYFDETCGYIESDLNIILGVYAIDEE
jgi:hypothetical protein